MKPVLKKGAVCPLAAWPLTPEDIFAERNATC